MIVLVLTAIGVGSALFTSKRVKRLARLPLSGLWLVWLAISTQVLLFEFLGQHLPLPVSNGIHLGTYALCLAFLWRNRHLPGGWIITVGTASNLLAIAANGGTMPADMDAWRRAGLPEFDPDVFENSRALSSPRLAFLGDVFAIPEGWPLANVFSIGDVLIVIGGTYLAHMWCRAPRHPAFGSIHPEPAPPRVAAPTHRTRSVRAVVVTVGVGALATLLSWSLVWSELHASRTKIDWQLFAIIAAFLIACEWSQRTWIRFGPIGVVTPLWMFSYALMLLGAPSAALAVALLGATLHSVRQDDEIDADLVRLAGTAVSLASAGLVLNVMGVNGAITQFDTVPWRWAVAIILAGITIVVLNAIIAALSLSARRKVSFLALLRRGLGVRVTAEGALLSLAPIWVIGIDFSVVLVPLLAITTVLVFRSTRQALERYQEAHHDALTGLVNRRAFIDQLTDALADHGSTSRPTVLIMDLNGFKEINDRLGHQLGDSLLVAFAERLEAIAPRESTSARLGGDEFAVLLTDQGDDVMEVIGRMHRELTRPLWIEGFPVTVGVSIGVARAPEDGHTRTDLLRAADVAMYRAKRTGTRIERYDNRQRSPQRGRLDLLGDLNAALHRHQLYLQFQPQLRMRDGKVDTVEALVRWDHPEYGEIAPEELIGLAEQTDLIGPITTMVLRTAAQGLLLGHANDLKLAVNVSARSLEDPQFASHVLKVLDEAEFPPHRLELEVTERALVGNAERTTYTIDQLRAAGVGISIDDFGVGYSSYQTLRLLEVDRVKIDRDFVQDILASPRSRTIVASLVKLAHDLDLTVVAEGVESTAVWDELASLGCDLAQGYGIAVPMMYPELRDWMTNWRAVLTPDQVAEPV